ncbi:zinc finger protein 107-like [Hyperolius riggenbachi]|uniref:zinc finger protein 107-like n=1 Tax=Hyperolius riggenbachi TaxID=752182 RepID=UPI0035A2F332
MDQVQEVGAEVELNEGSSAGEDSAVVKLENKRDLPQWTDLHCFDSSSDDSLGYEPFNSTPPKIKRLEIPKHGPDIKRKHETKDALENIYVLSTTEDLQTGCVLVNETPGQKQSFTMNNVHNQLLDQVYHLEPSFEENEVSCIEVIPSSEFGQLISYSPEVYTETALSREENPRQTLGKYSYFDTRTQCTRSVNPMERIHKCERCGRQFGRLYNLEKHMCINMAVGPPQQHSIETMNRLEKMCAEAQEELQNLQGHHKNHDMGTLIHVATKCGSPDIQVWSQEAFSGVENIDPTNRSAVTCDRCGGKFKSAHNLQFHVCNENAKSFVSQNLTSPEDTIVFDLTDSHPISCVANQEQVWTGQTECIPLVDQGNGKLASMSSLNSEENFYYTQFSVEGAPFYQCQECGKVYNKRCSITNHMRWHLKEKNLISSVVNAFAGDQEPEKSTHLGGATPVDTKADLVKSVIPSQTFFCEYCGETFNKHCSYATHTCWHFNNKDHMTNGSNGTDSETGQVVSISVSEQEGDNACTSPAQGFTCDCCGRVFNKQCAYISHTCWQVKQQESKKRAVAKSFSITNAEYLNGVDTKVSVNKSNMIPAVENGESGLYSSSLNGDIQGYVGQLSLDERPNLSPTEPPAQSREERRSSPLLVLMEPNQKSTAEDLQSVPELLEDTATVSTCVAGPHEHVSQYAEDNGNVKDVIQDLVIVPQAKLEIIQGLVQVPQAKLEPSRQPPPTPFILPKKLVTRLLNRYRAPHRCRDCGVRFCQPWRLRLHRFKVDRNKGSLRKHYCDCGRTPIGSLHFLLHQLQHLSDTAFICAVCAKALHGYRQLQAHSWVHPLASQFQCRCGARFTKLPKYLWHSLRHKPKPGQKPQLGIGTEVLLSL